MRQDSFEIPSADGHSLFRVEKDNYVRLILKPEDKAIKIGKLSVDGSILRISKSKSLFNTLSYNLSVPEELVMGLPDLETVALIFWDTNIKLCILAAEITAQGIYTANDEAQIKKERQRYVFVDKRYWTQVSEEEDIENFYDDRESGNY